MKRVFFYSILLLAGIGTAQTIDLMPYRPVITILTMICLSYIMIEVGLDFALDKTRLKAYDMDLFVAVAASALPWIFCAAYIALVLGASWKEAWLVGLFAAPTSAGVLFTMLAAAGLGATWVYRKARVLAIFDDLATILFIIPLQVLFLGFHIQFVVSLVLVAFIFIQAYRRLHRLAWPVDRPALVGYAIALTALCSLLDGFMHIHLEVLIPSFALGCALKYPKSIEEEGDDPTSVLDQGLKALFMVLVGICLPQMTFSQAKPSWILLHVVALTLLANLGKCFALVCYRQEANLKERLALSLALFPRGEVGAGVLMIALGYGLTGLSQTLAGLCLAVNLLLTGVFIFGVKKLLNVKAASR